LAAGRLAEPFALRLPSGFGYYLIYPPATAERPKIRAFSEWVVEEMASQRAAALAPSLSHANG
jgi:LysR family glycine cleavage system transcriptional activator